LPNDPPYNRAARLSITHYNRRMDMRKPATDFSGVSYEEALRRARELIPLLREQAAACEAARKLTPAVMDALTRTGLMRYLQPKVWGGMELPFVSYFDIPEPLSRGDACYFRYNASLAFQGGYDHVH